MKKEVLKSLKWDDLNGCCIWYTFFIYSEEGTWGESYYGVIKDHQFYNLYDEGNFFEGEPNDIVQEFESKNNDSIEFSNDPTKPESEWTWSHEGSEPCRYEIDLTNLEDLDDLCDKILDFIHELECEYKSENGWYPSELPYLFEIMNNSGDLIHKVEY